VSGPRELLTIIVPVYNEVGTVRTVIDRLVSVDLPVEREIVVVDDGSTDGTREVLRKLPGDLRVRVLEAERNGGKGSAVRRGLQEARGSIVAIQDADLELDAAHWRNWWRRSSPGTRRSCTDRGFCAPMQVRGGCPSPPTAS
jgi:glycosyltransferase involved in cell wall biosynthesis